MQKNFYSKASLGMLAVGFLVFVAVINLIFSWARLDLTEDGLYSLSDGTKNIIEKIDEPITLNFFFSNEATKDRPLWRNYGKRVKEFLQEYQSRAGDKIRLNIIDPEPFSEAEDQAAQYGLQTIPTQSGDEFYFGLVGANSVDKVESIPFFDPRKEQFLEYDISKLVYSLVTTKRPIVGLLSGLEVTGGMDMATRRPTPAWVVFEQAQQLFEIRELSPTMESVDEDIDMLMLVQPKGLSDQAKYAIDQFVLSGGKTMVFVDPNAEQDRAPSSPQNPFPQIMKGDDLNTLFKAWGFELPMDKVVGDRVAGLDVGMGQGGTVKHVAILGLQEGNLDTNDVALANLEQVILSTPGYLKPIEGSTTKISPLIETTDQAKLFDASRFMFLPDPSSLLDNYAPSGDRYTIAARISGKAKSAYSGRPTADKTESADSANKENHLSESNNGINVLVFADTDMLANRFWVEVQQFFGSQIFQAFADNGNMVLNSIENMAGSSDLIGLRGRGRYTRPFDVVEELKFKADQQFRAKEQELQAKLSATEEQLAQLTSQIDESGQIILGPEQKAAIAQFQEEKLAIRKQLRDVRHQLDKDIQALGTTLKFINIGLVPLILMLISLIVYFLRRGKAEAA